MADDETVFDSDENDLVMYGASKEKDMVSELLEKEAVFQDPITPQETQINEKYGKFLTFKAHGSGKNK